MTCEEVMAKYPHHFSGPRGIECGDGWAELIDQFITELDLLPGGKELVFFSIKEKFGRLRIDEVSLPDGLSPDEMHRLEMRYEARSLVTCEKCGKLGKLTDKGWLKVLCEAHRKP